MSRLSISVLMIAMTVGLPACADRPGGELLTSLNTVAAPGSSGSHLATGGDGTVVMSWMEPDGERTLLRFSTLHDNEWSEPETIATGDNWFVNWADFPSVVPIAGDLWAAHWLVKQPGGTYSYDVAIAVSADGGQTWTDPVTPHDDGTPTEHGFVSLFPHDGGVGALWLDGRNMVGGHGAGDGGMTLRSAVVTETGDIRNGLLVDEFVCDCCQTDVAIGGNGPMAVYRDRTSDEIRDISIAHLAGDAWQSGTVVSNDGWEIAGCPVNGPSVAARGDDVVVTWFTAANNQPAVRLARSSDGGRSFAAATDLEAENAIGRVAVLLLDNGDTLASWLYDNGDGNAQLRIGRVDREGRLVAGKHVATIGNGRLSGFPQITLAGDHVAVSFTDTTDGQTRVLSLLLDPERLTQAPDW